MQQKFDLFNQAEKPSITLCNPSKEELFSLGACYNTKITTRFNALSEFVCTFPEYINGVKMDAYEYIQSKRLILIDNVGYFIISSIDEVTEGAVNLKNISCYSLESELTYKRIGDISYVENGVTSTQYALKNSDGSTDLLGILFGNATAYVPNWTVTFVSTSLISTNLSPKERSFDVKDGSVYEFIMTDISTAFDCIFTFNTFDRTIQVYDKASALTETDIYISYDNLVKSSVLSEKSDEIVTCLGVYGAGDLDIRTVNPLGSTKVYNFDYYANTNWMSQSLINAINTWKIKVTNNQAVYAGLLDRIKTKWIEYDNYLNGSDGYVYWDAQRKIKEIALKETIEEEASEDDIRLAKINLDSVITKLNNITDNYLIPTQTQIDNLRSQLDGIVEICSINNPSNFTTSQLNELYPFIIENTYQNPNFVQTDSMTNNEVIAMAQQLYDQVTGANGVLERVSQPRYEFSVETVNFILLKEFLAFTEQLQLGCEVYINIGEKKDITTVLLEISYSYENPEDFTLTFSNRLRLDNGSFILSDLFGDPMKAGSSVSFNSGIWSNWKNEYKTEVSEFISGSLDAAKNELISSTNQEITINESGLRGKKLSASSTENNILYEPNEIWLTSNMLAFTDDNWSSAKTALGRHRMPDNSYAYGLVGEVVVGRLIAGQNLLIQNQNSTFSVDGSGATITNGVINVYGNGGTSLTTISPVEGISIKKLEGTNYVPKFYADDAGNVVLTGSIQATQGTLGGWTIGATGLSDTNGNYINSNGNIKLGKLSIVGSTATFDGIIRAENILESDGSTGKLSASRISAGIIDANITVRSPRFEWKYAVGSTTINDFGIMDININTSDITNSELYIRSYGKFSIFSSTSTSFSSTNSSGIQMKNDQYLLLKSQSGSNYTEINLTPTTVTITGPTNISGYVNLNGGFTGVGSVNFYGSTAMENYKPFNNRGATQQYGGLTIRGGLWARVGETDYLGGSDSLVNVVVKGADGNDHTLTFAKGIFIDFV